MLSVRDLRSYITRGSEEHICTPVSNHNWIANKTYWQGEVFRVNTFTLTVNVLFAMKFFFETGVALCVNALKVCSHDRNSKTSLYQNFLFLS